MLFPISFSTCNRVGKRTDWADGQTGLDPCWSQTHYVVLSWCGSHVKHYILVPETQLGTLENKTIVQSQDDTGAEMYKSIYIINKLQVK
jgi:hypothetical protein